MHNLIKDKYNILGLIGSFYTNQMNSQASKQAGRITYVPFQTNITSKINQIIQYLSGNCYSVADYLVIPISETVIEYGVLGENQDVRSIEYKNFYKTYINNLELQKNQRIVYKINFNEDIYITALQLEEDASLLFEGVDFTSEFGCIYTYNTPSSIFGDSLHVRKYIQKQVNSNNYRLGVQDVYGDTNFITDFYRNNQSLKAFKYALLQAAGFPIIQEDDYIKNKLRTKNGCVYVTSSGKFYTADFKHNELNINDAVTKNQYIGSEILSIILPEDPIPRDLTYITFNGGSITGNKDIIISNSIRPLFNNDIFIAENFAQGPGRQAYLNYVKQLGDTEKPSSSVPDSMNGIDFLRNVVANDRCIILNINKDALSYDMAMKLKSFIIDNSPIGAIIAESLKSGDVPPIIINTPTSISCFGNESRPDRPFITDSFYLNVVPDTLCQLSNGDTLFFDASVSNFWTGAVDGTIENTWYNTKAVNQLNEALNLGDNGFTNADFSQGSFVYYTSTGQQNSTSTVTLDVSATAKVGDKIVIMASVASRQHNNRGFQITGISDQDIKLSYAGVYGDGFSFVNTNRVDYNPNNTENWSPERENVNIFMAEGTLTSTKLVLSQPNTIKNGWQFIGYKTSREVK